MKLTRFVSISIVVLVCASNGSTAKTKRVKLRLELLQVLMRHGDRTPDETEWYTTDPHAELFKRYGVGQLTNIGKKHAYEIGRALRRRYNVFLGDYKVGEVAAYSSDRDRTKMTLDLALAGLYPPTCSTSWSDRIAWSPVPISYNRTESDMLTSYTLCPRYISILADIWNSGETDVYLHRHTELLRRVRSVTNLTLSNAYEILCLWNNLKCTRSLGLPLPRWCSRDTYDALYDVARATFSLLASRLELARITVGPIFETFLRNIDAASEARARKIHLYSGHDLNIQPFLDVHNFTNKPDYADFGSALVVESLRSSDGQVYVKASMWTGLSKRWIRLRFRKFGLLCPLPDYVDLVSWALPDNETRRCFSPDKRCAN